MSAAKKFGTFAGVYTPSVLTILGVIMYMRLGWVVGEAGLIGTIIIILVAHVISITTGLSISSIATDKKIKTGGIYYILSRSLGLPMGGSIGITLFVGTALSIALYIVGFTENFLGIDAISNFLGMANDINSVRIIGSIVLVVLFAIAFISTSLAIKSQFFVLGAIALSLISIFLGFVFVDPSQMPQVAMSAAPNHVPIMTIFAIFFPAVTGFTAGVAMSGDLKDPKSSIPKGTMLSIATGLVVYVLLALGLAYFVDRDTLINDSNFLIKIAIYSPFVIAGIWGATLSSALGGILGAPRIVQAIANDKIIPKFLGKGYGESNEPRNALIFTFFIAEIGILIGELDAIAEVVSMFYIAAYGFINLAFSLERWASTDFRPSFSINKWIGIMGFVASFGVMLELNPGAMIAAFIIMWLIYFLLKRKELKSDFGDVWGSVWSSMVRTSITKLTEKSLEKRNWKPNILLFSGKLDDRPYLLELSKKVVGKYGFLSHFDLQITEDDDVVFTKRDQVLESDEQAKGIFYRRKTVKNVYDGIEQIASTYGFAGVEPNTVFLGWARNTKSPSRFVKMLKNIYALDLNVVMMDYDHNVGFGDKKQIDVWWRGKGQNGNLSLQLVKFLRESDDWSKAVLRLLIVNDRNEEYEDIYKQASQIIHNLRIDGEIRVINNQIEKKTFYEIVQEESINSSLIFMGLPEIDNSKQNDFIETTNDLCKKIGTVILVKASTSFIDLSIGIAELPKRNKLKSIDDSAFSTNSKLNIEDIDFTKYPNLAQQNRIVFNRLNDIQSNNNIKYLKSISDNEAVVLEDFEKVINTFTKSIKLVISSSQKEHLNAKISSIHTRVLKDVLTSIEKLKSEYIEKQKNVFSDFILNEVKEIKSLYGILPKHISVNYTIDDLKPKKGDGLDIKLYKFTNRLLFKLGIKLSYKVNYQQLVVEKLLPVQESLISNFLFHYGFISSQNMAGIEKFVNDLNHEMQFIYQNSTSMDNDGINKLEQAIININSLITDFKKEVYDRSLSIVDFRSNSISEFTNKLNTISAIVGVNSMLDEEFNIKKAINRFGADFIDVPAKRYRNQKFLLNHLLINVNLLNYSTQLSQVTNLVVKRLNTYLNNDVIDFNSNFLGYLKKYLNILKEDRNAKFEYDLSKSPVLLDKVRTDNMVRLIQRNHKNLLKNLPKEVLIFTEESDNLIGSEKQFGDLETVNVSVVRLLDYLVQDEFINMIKLIVSELTDEIYDRNQKLFDRLRILNFHVANEDLDTKDLIEIFEEEIALLELENANGEEYVLNINRKIDERKRVIMEKLGVYPFLQSAMNLKQYIRRREADKRANQFVKLKNSVYEFYANQAAKLWYRQSKSFMLTQSFMKEENDSLSIHKKQAKAIANLDVNSAVLEKLPIYYKQLFADNQNYISEMWVERKESENELTRFLNDYRLSNSRALLIRGEKGSGKSFLSYRMTSMLENESKVFTIIPPEEGSIDLSLFKRSLKENLDIEGDDPISLIPDNSTLIFEDMELWWQKSADGFAVVDYIFNLILQNSNRIRIVAIFNSYAFDFISKLRNVTDYFTHDIILSSFDAFSLQQLIWKRHSMGGLNLNIDNKDQNSLHSWDFARLFSKYFRISKGLPATAISFWLNNITESNGKEITMSFPKTPDLRVCEELSLENLWVLQLLVIHSNITAYKLARITNWQNAEAMKKLFELAQVGFIVEYSPNIFSVNTLLRPFIINLLKSKKYL